MIEADWSTIPAASLYPYYKKKEVVKTFFIVTDEGENGRWNNYKLVFLYLPNIEFLKYFLFHASFNIIHYIFLPLFSNVIFYSSSARTHYSYLASLKIIRRNNKPQVSPWAPIHFLDFCKDAYSRGILSELIMKL